MKNLVKIVTILLVSLLAFSCASSLSATRTRPAELDLNGANSIAVLPFQVNSKQTEVVNILGLFAFTVGNTNTDEVKLASEVTNAVQEMFLNSGYMQVVGSQRVQEALQGNTAIPCDVYISGSILEFSNKINSSTTKNKDGSETTNYKRDLQFTVRYEVIDSQTNRVIDMKTKTLSNSSSYYSSRNSVSSMLEVAKPEINELVSDIKKQIQPYTVTKSFSMKKIKSDDSLVKEATAAVKAGSVNDALDKYLALYNKTGIYEAGHNAVLLLQYKENYSEAKALCQELYNKTGSKDASRLLSDIEKEIMYQNKLQKQNTARSIRAN